MCVVFAALLKGFVLLALVLSEQEQKALASGR